MNKAKLSIHLNIYEKNSPDKITKGQNIKIVTEWRSTTHTLFHVKENLMAYKIPSSVINNSF